MSESSWEFNPSSLATARQGVSWSQKELARRVNRKVSSISAYEQGDRIPSLPVLCLLAQVLGMTPNDLCKQPPPSKG